MVQQFNAKLFVMSQNDLSRSLGLNGTEVRGLKKNVHDMSLKALNDTKTNKFMDIFQSFNFSLELLS